MTFQRSFALAFAFVMLLSPVANAETVADFYKGKTITLVNPYPPGSSRDAAGRLLVRHLPRHIPGEPAIVARLAAATLPRSRTPWRSLAEDYDRIRERIAEVIPGFEDFNLRVRVPGGFHLHHPGRERVFPTASGKAEFFVHPLDGAIDHLRRNQVHAVRNEIAAHFVAAQAGHVGYDFLAQTVQLDLVRARRPEQDDRTAPERQREMHCQGVACHHGVTVTQQRGEMPDGVIAAGIEQVDGRTRLEALVSFVFRRASEQQKLQRAPPS